MGRSQRRRSRPKPSGTGNGSAAGSRTGTHGHLWAAGQSLDPSCRGEGVAESGSHGQRVMDDVWFEQLQRPERVVRARGVEAPWFAAPPAALPTSTDESNRSHDFPSNVDPETADPAGADGSTADSRFQTLRLGWSRVKRVSPCRRRSIGRRIVTRAPQPGALLSLVEHALGVVDRDGGV